MHGDFFRETLRVKITVGVSVLAEQDVLNYQRECAHEYTSGRVCSGWQSFTNRRCHLP